MSVTPKNHTAQGNGVSLIDYSVSQRGLGASPMDWDDAVRIDLLEDLLPVVSNTATGISPNSSLTTLGKVPSMYSKDRHVVGFKGWAERKTTAAMVEAWKRESDYGICMQTRRLRALDIDIKDAALSGAIVAAVCRQLGIPAIPRRYRTGTGKCLLPFWLFADEQGDFHKGSFKVASGEVVEFLASGEQFVAVATHTSGTRYQWGDLDCLPDADEIPTLTREQFESLWASLIVQFAMPDSASKSNGATRSEVAKNAIKNDPVAVNFIDAGMVRSYRPDGGLNVRCPQENLHSDDSGATATVYWPPHTGYLPYRGFECKHEHCTEFKIRDVRKFFDLSDANQPSEPKRFCLLTVDQLLKKPRPTWWIKGVLPRAALIVVYGEAGSGKSAFAYDMVVSLVNGTPWCDRVVQQCRVVWIAAEGAGGHRNRTEALDKAHGLDRARLLTLLDAPDLLDAEQVKELATTINASGGADVVAIDTVAQATPGANENSSEDMGMLIAHCRTLHELTGASILLVHHAGKDRTKGARGWSGLRAAVDAEIEITRNGDDRVARISKMKDGDDKGRFPFILRVIPIGIDADGEEITAVGINHMLRPIAVMAPKPKGPIEAVVYNALVLLQPSDGKGHVAIAQVIDAAVPRLAHDPKKRDRRRFSATRAIEGLAHRGVICVENDCAWLRHG
jgi:hypothetical protein